MDKQFELEVDGAEDTLRAQGMHEQGIEAWLPLLHALEGVDRATGGCGLTWWVDVQPYDTSGRWRAWCTSGLVEMTLEWPK